MDNSSACGWRNGVCGLGNADLENAVRQANRGDGIAEIAWESHLFAKPPCAGCLDVQLGALDANCEFVRADGARSDGHQDFAWLIEHVDQMSVRAVDLRLRNGRLTSGRGRVGLL